MKRLLFLLILSFFSIQANAGSCSNGSDPVKSVSDDGTYFVFKCGGNNNKDKKTKEVEKKPNPKPDQSTSDALSSLINGPKSDGVDKAGEGDDQNPGDKGDPAGDPNSKSYYGNGKGLDGDGNYLLGGRKALNKKKFIQDCNEAGTVVVSIEVDRNGKVINATPGVRGTTNNSKCLLEPAKRAALATKFNKDAKAPSKQIGKIIYRFSLSE